VRVAPLRRGLCHVDRGAPAGAIADSKRAVARAQSAHALSFDDIQGLTYSQVKGSGRANSCPTLDSGDGASALKQGSYVLERFCMEPTKFTVKEESQFKNMTPEFVPVKLVTRLTYTLDQVRARRVPGPAGDTVPDPDAPCHSLRHVRRMVNRSFDLPFLKCRSTCADESPVAPAVRRAMMVPLRRASCFACPSWRCAVSHATLQALYHDVGHLFMRGTL
jgi:Manganese-stabilising protein / photosystem II polypeptide